MGEEIEVQRANVAFPSSCETRTHATHMRQGPLVSLVTIQWFLTFPPQNTKLLPIIQKLIAAANTLRTFLLSLLGQTEAKQNTVITEVEKRVHLTLSQKHFLTTCPV